ncbi:hypothetical protein BpHYR1_035923 [Brachionus plicatilis]|uniref:Uncharacterized protein n=1 Tax=Brachionus plicatilis TaxID=10195 RepID=A0A3M7QRI7_BRAPC|nr:hypothetical protein BpHYR1_035923 [Brachionus plicatilis]
MQLIHFFFFISIIFYVAESSSSFDSLISSQCKARCLSLIPWKLNERRVRSIHRSLMLRQSNKKRFTNNSDQHLRIRWQKVMDLCTKNENCLQCTSPCEIPTSLLSNCKYLCKPTLYNCSLHYVAYTLQL